MARILITSGPTRQYLDPIRYLTNASSGRMGKALAEAALAAGHQVSIVTGPVAITYPPAADVVPVISTEEMLDACQRLFPEYDGLIGVAAPCDYRPREVASNKIHKTGAPLTLELEETPDVVATIAASRKPGQWVVGFALDTEDRRMQSLAKLERKSCDLMVLNGPEAMNSLENRVEVVDRNGTTLRTLTGVKEEVAQGVFECIAEKLITPVVPPAQI